jgi:hypothetical protein
MKTLLIDRFKYRQQEAVIFFNTLKYKIIGVKLISSFLSSFCASLVTLMVTYPFDLAYCRHTSQIHPKNIKPHYNTLSECFHNIYPVVNPLKDTKTQPPNPLFFTKYYIGFPLALYESLVFSTITLCGYQLLFNYTNTSNKVENESNFHKYFRVVGGTSLIALIASICAYPFDTMKRQYQVNGAKGFKNLYKYTSEAMSIVYHKGYSECYKGFPMHIIRTIPMSYIQYTIYASLVSFVEKKKEKKKNNN